MTGMCPMVLKVAAYAAFRSRTLGQLSVEDEHTRRLRETIRTYIESGRNREATATVLGVHKNTVRYRLERARDILGRDVDSYLVHLQLALLDHAGRDSQNAAERE